MFRRISTFALALLAALGSLAVVTAEEFKEVGGKAKNPPKELTLDLGKGVKLELVLILAGEFMMGSPGSVKNGIGGEKPKHRVPITQPTALAVNMDNIGGEKPQHRVRITKPFYLGKYLVTQEQWEAVMGSNPSYFKGPKNPVETVSWDDCQKFLGKLNATTGKQGGKLVLPTEAQWEYACRAGSTTRYYFADDASRLGEYAWYDKNSDDKTHRVGEKKPNAWRLYDMYGNVWEWCQDWWKEEYYRDSPVDDPTGAATGLCRVFRGGSWSYPAGYCRSALRYSVAPGFRLNDLGLRLSRVPVDE